jgi:hypothetical protein
MHFAPGMNGIEYSITFDTVYATTGGESLGFSSTTNFSKKVRSMIVTKPPRNTNYVYIAELARGTNSNPTNAKLKVFELENSTTNIKSRYTEVSVTTDMSAVTMRAIFLGA